MSTPPRSFRQAMSPLHTWAGVVFAALLFVVFWTGTLLVFDRELDRWLQPSTRLPPELSRTHAGLDGPVLDAARRLTAGASSWFVRLPTERQPTVELSWVPRGSEDRIRLHLDPRTGAVLPDTGTAGATDFLFSLHYSLHIDWQRLGAWIVGAAGMAMVLLLVSGLFVHRRLIADFFLFRPRARLQRASLDLHNVTGVLLLPFHLMITLTGLAILINTHWPTVYGGAYAQATDARKAFFAEAYATYKRPARPPPSIPCWPLPARPGTTTSASSGCGTRGMRTRSWRCAAVTSAASPCGRTRCFSTPAPARCFTTTCPAPSCRRSAPSWACTSCSSATGPCAGCTSRRAWPAAS
jgi:uncharacterized iron-regulated membrane protein